MVQKSDRSVTTYTILHCRTILSEFQKIVDSKIFTAAVYRHRVAAIFFARKISGVFATLYRGLLISLGL